MRALLVVLACVTLSIAATSVVVRFAGPSTADLDTDIKLARGQLEEANSDVRKYSGGLIFVEAQLRVKILQNTIAMLEQKRESFLRGINIIYQDPVARMSVQDPNSLAELAKAEADARAAHAEAEEYSGGLIQTMALVREATAKATIASVQQRLELARAGIPPQSFGTTQSANPIQPGNTNPG